MQENSYHAHHIIPRANGGRDVKYNLILICYVCHNIIHNGRGEQQKIIYDRMTYFMMFRYGIIGRKDMMRMFVDSFAENKNILQLQDFRMLNVEAKAIGLIRYKQSFIE